MKKAIYSTPKVIKAKQGWYVYFRYAGQQKRYKLKLNYITDLVRREKEFNSLCKAIHKKLESGWNPLVPEAVLIEESISLLEALEYALEEKKPKVEWRTFSGYKGSIKFYKYGILKLNLEFLRINELKRAHIKKIAAVCQKHYKWTNKTYNQHLRHISALLTELIEWEIIEHNPAHKIKALPVDESLANIPATPKQHQEIKEELMKVDPNFFIFIATIFHTGMRPLEILKINLSMVDMAKQQIILPSIITKSNKERVVPINNHLRDLFQDSELHIYPRDFFLFGSYRQKGSGNRGELIDFIPGPTRLTRNTATARWKRIVKDGLGIQVNMYSNKHAGANAKILAGLDLDTLRELYGHSSKLMTMRYAKIVKEVYRQQIIDKSPEF